MRLSTRLTDYVRENAFVLNRSIDSLHHDHTMSASQAASERRSILNLVGSLQQEVKLAADANTSTSNSIIERFSSSMMSSFEDRLSSLLNEKMAETMAQLEIAGPQQHHEPEQFSQRQDSAKAPDGLVNSATERARERVRRRSVSELVIWRSIRTPFGIAKMECIRKSRNLVYGSYYAGYNFELKLAFIPRLWLSRKASHITASWDTFPSCSLTGLNFQFRPVVSKDAPIMKACRGGDISKIKCLFETGQASVNMVDEFGFDLLIVSTR